MEDCREFFAKSSSPRLIHRFTINSTLAPQSFSTRKLLLYNLPPHKLRPQTYANTGEFPGRAHLRPLLVSELKQERTAISWEIATGGRHLRRASRAFGARIAGLRPQLDFVGKIESCVSSPSIYKQCVRNI